VTRPRWRALENKVATWVVNKWPIGMALGRRDGRDGAGWREGAECEAVRNNIDGKRRSKSCRTTLTRDGSRTGGRRKGGGWWQPLQRRLARRLSDRGGYRWSGRRQGFKSPCTVPCDKQHCPFTQLEEDGSDREVDSQASWNRIFRYLIKYKFRFLARNK
jgi:hypothetical protein